MKRQFESYVTCVLVFALSSACTIPIEGEDEIIESSAQSILGQNPQFVGCTSAQQQKLQSALQLIWNVVPTEEYEECIKNAQSIDQDFRMVEEIIDFSRTPDNLQINCVPSSCGSAGCAGPGPEQIELVNNFINTASIERIAGITIHELMHTKSWFHPSQVGHSVSDTVDACLTKLHPNGFGISELSDTVSLNHFGGGGDEQEVFQRCTQDKLAMAIRGRFTSNGLIRFGLGCQKELLGALTDYAQLPAFSSETGSNYFFSQCNTGEALVGVKGFADETVNAVQPLCAPLSTLKSNGFYTPVARGMMKGAFQGEFFERICPNRRVVMGFEVHESSEVNRVELICDDAHSLTRRETTLLVPVGGPGGSPFAQRICKGNSVMSGFFGSFGGTNQFFVQSLGGFCTPYTGEMALSQTYDSNDDNRLEAAGNPQVQEFLTPCNTGDVMVGAHIWIGSNLITDIDPICASDPDLINTRYTVPNNRTLGTEVIRTCSVGEVVIGFSGRDGALVDNVSLICTEPESGVSVTPSQGAGNTTGGTPFSERCPAGEPLLGLTTRVDSNALTAVGAFCSRSIGEATLFTDGYHPPVYGQDGTENTKRCGTGQVVTGLHGKADHLVRNVGIRCRPLNALKLGQSSPRVDLAATGNLASTVPDFEIECPLGEVALGLEGRTGSLVDRVQLLCGPPDLVPGDSISGSLDFNTSQKLFRINLPADRANSLTIRLTGDVGTDFDIRVRRGIAASFLHFDDGSFSFTSTEEITLDATVHEDIYYVLVNRFSGTGSFTLSIDP